MTRETNGVCIEQNFKLKPSSPYYGKWYVAFEAVADTIAGNVFYLNRDGKWRRSVNCETDLEGYWNTREEAIAALIGSTEHDDSV